jgi:hypothetical protein
MANPQKENGYTAISNEVLEHFIKYRFPKNSGTAPTDICLFVIRKTWGFGKKKDRISLTQFEEGTGYHRPAISYWLKYLVLALVLVEDKDSKLGNSYSFNKNYEQWKSVVLAREVVPARRFGSTSQHSKVVPALVHTKETKEITKERATGVNPVGEEKDTEIPEIIKEFEIINVACKNFYGNKTQRKACQDLIKHYGFERTKYVINKTLPATNSLPYFPTITTPVQLRDKWSVLESAIIKHRSGVKQKGRGFVE